ncbi:MAG: hypothetical protein A2505_03925 [Deltaproteobacteria bacterium RIFOXYD12_FULL_55_16]|nr:MAG: hypothetical protein A2505_03925 [Deltaproteobacteria bacterium RIFOXYD12_FULL_55_16]
MAAQIKSLSDLKAVLLRRRWYLILPSCAIFWATVATVFLLPSIYRSTSTILIEEQEIPTNLVRTTVTRYAQQRLGIIYQRLISTSRILAIIKEFHLYPELQNKISPDEIAAKMKGDIVLNFIKADVVDPKTGQASPATIAFTLSYQGKKPEQTQKIASVLTSLFLEEYLKDREKTVSGASSFLLEEVNRITEVLAESDAKIADYKEQHLNELPELLQVNMQSLQNTETNSDRLFEQMRTSREREGYLESQLASIPKQEMQKKRLEELRIQLSNLKARFSDQYPDVILVKAEIEKIIAEKEASKEEISDNSAYIILAAQLASIKAEIASLNKQIAANEQRSSHYRVSIAATPWVEKTYKSLLNDRDNQLRNYNELMQKYMEAQVAQGLEKDQKGGRLTVVEPAQLPKKPYKPNRLLIVLVSIVLGVGAGVGLAALVEFNDQSILNAEDLAKATSFPVLVVIPEILHEQERLQAQKMNRLQFILLLLNLGLAFIALLALRFVN